MRSYVKKTLEKGHLRGSVIVVKDGNAEQISVGYAKYKKRNNGSKKVVYPLGSLQKVVTGAMVTQLIYQKKFSQNTKISRWYPSMRNASKITVGQLMTHTSGINVVGTESSHGRKFSEAGAINWVVSQVNRSRRYGVNQFNYNNANYILLAGIIRKVTHKSYASNLKSRIVKPLHLHQTYIYGKFPKKILAATSYLYRYGKNYQSPVNINGYAMSQMVGAGNLCSSPADYYKIMCGLTNGKILTKKQYNYMTHLDSKRSTYSGGLYAKKSGKLKLAYGNCGDTHFANWMQITGDNQNGIVMFLNQSGGKNHNKSVGYKILNHIKTSTFLKN
ncbi:penicillin-binding protein [Lactobacillus hamsteri DSM 5661 = JCM 6256]|uniref:Penicillin-binding protein n=2 Tax=Lactobacillus hamsteri TaxID=96565 RepID=A0A0R1YD72_9LACO|nr:serine hydrolase domain-containing protein [Lactobacillus hamsteri]KRM40520.1 penicillin-binding protein [Lactobacillus hamsteri DSM 5661 = JCM 6256]